MYILTLLVLYKATAYKLLPKRNNITEVHSPSVWSTRLLYLFTFLRFLRFFAKFAIFAKNVKIAGLVEDLSALMIFSVLRFGGSVAEWLGRLP